MSLSKYSCASCMHFAVLTGDRSSSPCSHTVKKKRTQFDGVGKLSAAKNFTETGLNECRPQRTTWPKGQRFKAALRRRGGKLAPPTLAHSNMCEHRKTGFDSSRLSERKSFSWLSQSNYGTIVNSASNFSAILSLIIKTYVIVLCRARPRSLLTAWWEKKFGPLPLDIYKTLTDRTNEHLNRHQCVKNLK